MDKTLLLLLCQGSSGTSQTATTSNPISLSQLKAKLKDPFWGCFMDKMLLKTRSREEGHAQSAAGGTASSNLEMSLKADLKSLKITLSAPDGTSTPNSRTTLKAKLKSVKMSLFHSCYNAKLFSLNPSQCIHSSDPAVQRGWRHFAALLTKWFLCQTQQFKEYLMKVEDPTLDVSVHLWNLAERFAWIRVLDILSVQQEEDIQFQLEFLSVLVHYTRRVHHTRGDGQSIQCVRITSSPSYPNAKDKVNGVPLALKPQEKTVEC
jgi:hypothetical protein